MSHHLQYHMESCVSIVPRKSNVPTMPMADLTLSNLRYETANSPVFLTVDVEPNLFAVLPRCHQLTRLICGRDCSLESVFEFATSSSTLVELALNLNHCDAVAHDRPVRRFKCQGVPLDIAIDGETRRAFSAAMLKCRAMDTLIRADCDVDLDSTMLPASLTLRRLFLNNVALAPRSLVAVADASRMSTSVDTLSLAGLNRMEGHAADEYTAAFATLFECLGAVKVLHVSRCGLDDAAWTQLGPILATHSHHLESINLNRNGVSDVGAAAIAHAIQTMPALCRVEMTGNKLTLERGVVDLVNGSCQRKVPLTHLRVYQPDFSPDGKRRLLAFAKQRQLDLML
ncbi:Aste57867_15592 [Aphanomyces stellatus]|uniref:Aste57867_15592 protein n=1 Tax=Aphanomyces stellatus TaxID=120398 RepID=A0A485L6G2_9STRA|nr:hypothetical protein As57867_015536 [Aphanomyces stellatus]VFT92394.1 Aste57867_15592 [Aphanomyces stellatus]